MENNFIVIGIMTGTSLDGIDVAIVDFGYDGIKFSFEELFFETYLYPDRLKEKIYSSISNKLSAYEFSQLNFAISQSYADSVKSALDKAGISKDKVHAIGMHGQTIWHQPQAANFGGKLISSTLQLGNISVLNQLTGINVVGDFRSADIALGGQGAPLVPIFDYYFLGSKTKNIVALNIGGISNITYLSANTNKNNIAGFDTGPGNVLIDIASKKYFDTEYDDKGSFAKQGIPDQEILDKLMATEFISKQYPKSTGRELFNVMFFNKYFIDYPNGYNALCTLTHFTAKSIAQNIMQSNFDPQEIIVSGGGAHNDYLCSLISYYLNGIKVIKSNDKGIGTDSKESICFAFLALLNILNINSNVPSVTGSKCECVLGVSAGCN